MKQFNSEDIMTSSRERIIPVSGSGDETNDIKDKEAETNSPELTEDVESHQESFKGQLQRLHAEFQNYKKRVTKEREQDFSIAKGMLASQLLPVLDDFERMIQHHQVDKNCDVDGVNLVFQKLIKILADEKLETIEAVGQPFDPECHEAVGVEETTADQDNLVLEEWEKGYRFNGRLLRPSRVKVGRYVKQPETN